jgi:hypothetical protein
MLPSVLRAVIALTMFALCLCGFALQSRADNPATDLAQEMRHTATMLNALAGEIEQAHGQYTWNEAAHHEIGKQLLKITTDVLNDPVPQEKQPQKIPIRRCEGSESATSINCSCVGGACSAPSPTIVPEPGGCSCCQTQSICTGPVRRVFHGLREVRPVRTVFRAAWQLRPGLIFRRR